MFVKLVIGSRCEHSQFGKTHSAVSVEFPVQDATAHVLVRDLAAYGQVVVHELHAPQTFQPWLTYKI